MRSPSSSLRTWRHCSSRPRRASTSNRGTITLQGLSPSTLYFADRPQREVGHMSSRQFVANWGEGDDGFHGRPPERRPVVRGAGRRASRGCGRGNPRSAPGRRRAHLQHQGPRRHRTGCHRAMCAVHRPIGASRLSPVSVAGVHRRQGSPGALRGPACAGRTSPSAPIRGTFEALVVPKDVRS